MTPTIDMILEIIRENPGIITLDIVRKFSEYGADRAAFDRCYHCVRVKITYLAGRGEIYRVDLHKPGRAAKWYPRGYAQ